MLFFRKNTITKLFSILFILFFIMIYFIFSLTNSSLAINDNSYIWNTSNLKLNSIETSSKDFSKNYIKPISTNPLNLNCGAACLIEEKSGLVLYDYKMHDKLRPASVTKIMSLLLIMEALDSGKINLNDRVPCSIEASKMGGSQIWLDVKEKLTVNDMLKAICIVSANDCVVAMAEFLEGSQEAFVNKMNEKAKLLNMHDTTFKNCHGIDEDGHLTSAYDIAIMSRELLYRHPKIKNYTKIKIDSLRNGKSTLVNTNKLLKSYSGCTGLKTGSTSLALYNLSASATRNNLSLISVILKSPDSNLRFNLSKQLLDYGFNNYSVKSYGKKKDFIKEIQIKNGVKSFTNCCLEDDLDILINNATKNSISKNIIIYPNIEAPIIKNQKIGEIQLLLNNKIIKTSNLISNETIDKRTFKSSLNIILNNLYHILK